MNAITAVPPAQLVAQKFQLSGKLLGELETLRTHLEAWYRNPHSLYHGFRREIPLQLHRMGDSELFLHGPTGKYNVHFLDQPDKLAQCLRGAGTQSEENAQVFNLLRALAQRIATSKAQAPAGSAGQFRGYTPELEFLPEVQLDVHPSTQTTAYLGRMFAEFFASRRFERVDRADRIVTELAKLERIEASEVVPPKPPEQYNSSFSKMPPRNALVNIDGW
jgi:hypothetical protein